MKNTILFNGQIQEVTSYRVAQRIGAERYQAIKTLEPHPCFIELCVAEAGESTGRVLGKGNVRKRWRVERIQELAERFKSESFFAAPSLYDGHDDANAKRREIGKLFEGWVNENKAFAFGIVTDKEKAQDVVSGKLDICSIEAAVEFRAAEDGVWEVERILDEPLAVALASSRETQPGFATAGVLQVIQETKEDEKEKRPMTLKEIRAACEELGLRPDQIFSKETLLSLGIIRDAIANEVAERERALAAEREKLAAEKVEAEKRAAEAQAKAQQYELAQRRQAAREIVMQAPAMKDVPLGAVPYVVSKLPDSILQEPDETKRIAAIQAEAKRIMDEAAALGIVFGAPAQQKTSNIAPPAKSISSGKPDYTKKEFNELIPD